MRHLLIALLAAVVLLAGVRTAPRADERGNRTNLFDKLSKGAQAALKAYEEETKKRLLELDNLFDTPPDEPHESPTIWRYIIEEEKQERTVAWANAMAAEMADAGELTEAATWAGEVIENIAEQWAWISLEGEYIYMQDCEIQQRIVDFLKAEAFFKAFKDWFFGFASIVDDAAYEGKRALESGKRSAMQAALPKVRAQFHVASMLDDVWERYQEICEAAIEDIEKDEYEDVDTWFADWPFEDQAEGEFAVHIRRWAAACEQNYNAMRHAEGDAEYFMEPIMKGTFLSEKSYKQIRTWLADGGMSERMEWLVKDLEKALK